jgi:formate-dependent nitrite reductase membrane component NrfD
MHNVAVPILFLLGAVAAHVVMYLLIQRECWEDEESTALVDGGALWGVRQERP